MPQDLKHPKHRDNHRNTAEYQGSYIQGRTALLFYFQITIEPLMLFLQLVDLFLVFLNERAELGLGSSATEPSALELFELLSFLLEFLALSDECVAEGL